MRQNYEKPAMQVVEIKMEQAVMNVTSMQSLGGNVFQQNSIGGSNQAARVKRDCYNVWDDEW